MAVTLSFVMTFNVKAANWLPLLQLAAAGIYPRQSVDDEMPSFRGSKGHIGKLLCG